MKYKIGDKVRIKSFDWYNENKDEDGRVMCGYTGFCKEMVKYCGKVLTIMTIGNQYIGSKQEYFMHETNYEWGFTDDMIEGLADVEPQEKMVSLDKVCECLKNTIDDDVLVKCGSVIKCMDVDDFVLYFRKIMEE